MGIFIPKGDPSWRQSEVNTEVPAGQFLRSLQFLRGYELAPKGNNSEVPARDFRASRIIYTQYTISTQIRVGAKVINSEVPAGYF